MESEELAKGKQDLERLRMELESVRDIALLIAACVALAICAGAFLVHEGKVTFDALWHAVVDVLLWVGSAAVGLAIGKAVKGWWAVVKL